VYLDHLDRYFVNDIDTEICGESYCNHTNDYYSFFISPNGVAETIKWQVPWLFVSNHSPAYFRVSPVTQEKYLYFSSDRVKTDLSPFQELGVDLVDVTTGQVELILKGIGKSHDVSPNGCKVAISRLVRGNIVDSRRSTKLAIVDLCHPNPKTNPKIYADTRS
jgi:hypothetical protein